MGRGKIEIKRIENPINRQVTYSKRRNGIFKKAQELTVLCDAKVSIIMFSNTSKLHEYISPNTSTKKIYDQYQKTLGIDLWRTHYERMEEHLRKLKEVNNRLRREIRQRMGEELNDLSVHELRGLERKMSASLTIIRDRKYHVIKTQTETYRKKVRNLEERHGNLLLDFEAKCELNPQYELVENEGDYDSAVAFANGVSNLYDFRLQPNHPNLHHGGGFGSHDLRLA
ncbi:agamous-like MADS-box protein TM6 [Actinidia eriantha]|uniref:agamous-like MADS-box protein TM6 n=1 Tax=Actinidia eriantha TaxID=165200 RepID=UPI00258AB026|nr:agamous-like MADS-box protein TM6 [Actinidia eriantha]